MGFSLKAIKHQRPLWDVLQTFTNETGQDLTFGNFIRYHDYEPEVLLVKESWSGWKAKAQLAAIPNDPDLAQLKKTLLRAALIKGPQELALLKNILSKISDGHIADAVSLAGNSAMSIYYRLWGDKGSKFGIDTLEDAFLWF